MYCSVSTPAIVSGFRHHAVSLISRQYESIREHQRIRSGPLEAARCRRGEDAGLKSAGMDGFLSRRQALATITVSTATVLAMPPAAFAQESNSVDRSTRTTPASREISPIHTGSIAISTTKSSSSEPSSFQESISGFVAGATLAGTKTLVKFPLDTATVRVQLPNSGYSIRDPFGLFNGCFNGISLTLLSNIPAGAVFFGVKDAVKTAIKNSDNGGISSMPRWMSTSLAVGVAMFPYWLVRNPSEVVKVRQQANIDGYGGDVSAIDAVKRTLTSSNGTDGEGDAFSELYTGYLENIFYALPADIIKFVAYDSITNGRKDLSPIEGARAGALATAVAQFVTTPLDVVRNRLMAGKDNTGNTLSNEQRSKGYIESLIALGEEEGLRGLFAGSVPRASKAILSGAIQFATYEETKQSMSKMLLQRR